MSLAAQLKDLQESRVSDLRRQAAAFAKVFGKDGGRSDPQQIVWAALTELCGQTKALTVLDSEGRIDPHSAVFNTGVRSVFLFIDSQLTLAQSAVPAPAPKPKR